MFMFICALNICSATIHLIGGRSFEAKPSDQASATRSISREEHHSGSASGTGRIALMMKVQRLVEAFT